MVEKFIKKTVDNNGVEIEYFVYGQVNDKSSLIISMGVWEPAERAFPLINRLSSTHCIVLSYRGRGKSSTPESGFDWQHHASDLTAVLEKEPAAKPVFLGFSKGVSYMLGYLSTHTTKPYGVIIIDYPALHIKSAEGYAKYWSNTEYNGIKMGDFISLKALEGIEAEASDKEFYSELTALDCPIWLFRGTDTTSFIPSNLTNDDMSRYKNSVKNLSVIDFDYSGHMILDEELGKASSNVKYILKTVDHGTPV